MMRNFPISIICYHFLNICDKKMDHLLSNNEMTQNRIWSEDPRDNAKHRGRELPNLDRFF